MAIALLFNVHGLAAILSFIGGKLLLADIYKIPIGISLGVVATLLAGSVIASLIFRNPTKEASTSNSKP